MKRICCFCEKWESGGIESFLHNILTRMDLSRMEVDIVASELCASVFTGDLARHGVKFYELSGNPRRLWQNREMFRKLLKERKYDVIHLNIYQGLSLYYARLAKNADVSVRIAHSHNTALRRSGTRWLKQRLHRCARKRFAGCVTDFWACSKPAAEFMFPRWILAERGVRLIPNGIDIERFRFDADARTEVRRELNVESKFVIGNVGRLCGQKNQDFLLEIFAALCERRSESVLILVGEGGLKTALRAKAERLGIANKVIFYGVTAQVERLLWAMDLFVMPSCFEGLGIVAIEAQAAGLPCILSDAIPREAQIMHDTTFISLHSGVKPWLDAVEGVASKKLDRRAGADKVAQVGFAVEDVARRIENFYLGLKT